MNIEIVDTELINLITSKDPSALEQLYDKYERPVYSFAYRMVNDEMMAEEVVQEVFLRIWNSAERYDAKYGKLTTWMFTLTRNIAIDLLRKKRSRMPEPFAPEEQLNIMPDVSQNTEAEVELKWIGEQVKSALDDLNPDQKQVVELIYYEGFTQQEVADKYSIPLGTVKSRVRLALKQLKSKLADIGRREVSHE
jgi:RNA polymerase sigma factor (sigma-70 family)